VTFLAGTNRKPCAACRAQANPVGLSGPKVKPVGLFIILPIAIAITWFALRNES